MGTSAIHGLALAGLCALASGCAGITPARGTADIDKLIAARGAPAPVWPADGTGATRGPQHASRNDTSTTEPLTLERAVAFAFERNAKVREIYAELGIAEADVLEASRIGNPTIGYVDLEPRGGGRGKITRSVSLGFTDLLLLPMRSRLARASFESVRDRVGASLIELQADVETAWFEYVNALQLAQMRDAAALTAGHSAEYAQRLHDAGNISRRALAVELAAASEARIDAARAKGQALRARAHLAGLIGLPSRDDWKVTAQLPAPLDIADPPEQIVDDALRSRLDLSATRREIVSLEGGLHLTRRWRWLGDLEVGYEWESEDDGARFRGPSFALQLPLFNRNAHGVLRAQSQLEAAQARLSEQELAVRNEVALELDELAAAREIAESYRTALVPLRESIVQGAQEEMNFMLIGAFELMQARREQLDAYQEYLEAVRDYWLARVRLRQATGSRLPGDEAKPGETLGVEAILAPGPAMDHSQMDHSHMDHSQMHHGDAQHAAPEHSNEGGEQK